MTTGAQAHRKRFAQFVERVKAAKRLLALGWGEPEQNALNPNPNVPPVAAKGQPTCAAFETDLAETCARIETEFYNSILNGPCVLPSMSEGSNLFYWPSE